MSENIDVDLSSMMQGEMDAARAFELLRKELLDVCSGKFVRAEVLGDLEVSISRFSASV